MSVPLINPLRAGARKVDNAELPRPTAGKESRRKNIDLFYHTGLRRYLKK